MIYVVEGLPTSVILPKKTKADEVFYLNLNVYRNAHFIKLNKAKKIFSELMRPKLAGLTINPPFIIRYYLTIGSLREVDVQNICSVVDKFFSDALVDHGCIPDDNYKFLKGVSSEYAGYRKGKSYITAEIIEL